MFISLRLYKHYLVSFAECCVYFEIRTKNYFEVVFILSDRITSYTDCIAIFNWVVSWEVV